VTLAIVLDYEGVMLHEHVPQGQAIIKNFCLQVFVTQGFERGRQNACAASCKFVEAVHLIA